MEMSRSYYDATLAHLRSKGFETVLRTEGADVAQESPFERSLADCKLTDDCHWVLEMLAYESGALDFYLEVKRLGRGRCFSFPLDSWKFHKDRIEFKFRDDPQTGLGLALTIDLN